MLQTLLGSTSVADFMERYYLKLPFARAAGAEHLLGIATPESIDRLLEAPEADVLVGREGQQWPEGRTPTPAEARRLLSEGYTIGVRHGERRDERLASLAAELQAELGGPIDVQVYWTPAEQPGFGWHYDPEEVFVIQLAGEKEWWLRKNTVHPWPLIEAIPGDQRYQREIMPAMRCPLRPGHWLYIPGGYWHRTQAGAESISLSVGVQAPTALELLDSLRPRLLDSLLWRQRLPASGTAAARSRGELSAEYLQIASALADDLAAALRDEEFISAFLDRAQGSAAAG